MRKSKPKKPSRNILLGQHPDIGPIDDGDLVVPIPVVLRSIADIEMRDFISRHKEKNRDIENH